MKERRKEGRQAGRKDGRTEGRKEREGRQEGKGREGKAREGKGRSTGKGRKKMRERLRLEHVWGILCPTAQPLDTSQGRLWRV